MAVAKELRKLSSEPPPGIKVLLNEEDVTDICADISGPGVHYAPRERRARTMCPQPSTLCLRSPLRMATHIALESRIHLTRSWVLIQLLWCACRGDALPRR
eukprot:scaffold72933_cov35-Tisochrysis_lutea.AAC.2